MTRECGQCSMCCKVLGIEEFAKPANVWCPHILKGGGCSIYETRYETCRGYQCAWLHDEALGPEWQPNRSKFIVHRAKGSKGIWINVDAGQPLAWKKEPFHSVIRQWSRAAQDGTGYVAVIAGRTTCVVFPEQELDVPGLAPRSDIKVGYRHADGGRRPLVMVRGPAGDIREFLGDEFR